MNTGIPTIRPAAELRRLSPGQLEVIRSFSESPPVKLGAIASAFGVDVKVSTLPSGISGEIRPSDLDPNSYVIRVNRHESRQRQRFTLAHELAHYLLHREYIGSGISDNALYRSRLSSLIEIEANRLGAELVMPARLLNRHLGLLDGLDIDETFNRLAEVFGVSRDAIEIRARSK